MKGKPGVWLVSVGVATMFTDDFVVLFRSKCIGNVKIIHIKNHWYVACGEALTFSFTYFRQTHIHAWLVLLKLMNCFLNVNVILFA